MIKKKYRYTIGIFVKDQLVHESYSLIGDENMGYIINSILTAVFKAEPKLETNYEEPHLAYVQKEL